jgi:DNA-binding transcriptional ArsR family regulator
VSWFSDKLGAKASTRLSAPLARKDDLVVEDFGGEVLVYDQRSDQAHCLSREAAMVWRVCDGQTLPAGLASALELDPEAVSAALDQLESAGLLETGPVAGVTRREATMRMAKVGGAAAAAPMIYSILAPTPALATSQATCLNVNPCDTSVNGGCDDCYKAGCACCGAGTSGSGKLCTQDCSPCYCTAAIIHQHCGGSGTSSTCTSGSNHLPTTC